MKSFSTCFFVKSSLSLLLLLYFLFSTLKGKRVNFGRNIPRIGYGKGKKKLISIGPAKISSYHKTKWWLLFLLVIVGVLVSLRALRLIPRASLPALFFFLLLLYLARLEIMLCSLLWSWNYVVLCYVWYGQSLELQ